MHEPTPIHRTSHVGVSSEEAARILGVSLTTIRRWIREGKLEAERVSRPQGYVLQVMVSAAAVEAAVSTTAADDHAPRRLHVATAPAAPPTAGTAEETPSDVLDTADQVRQDDHREAFRLIERQQQTIMELSGRVGYLQAALANARDTIRALQAPAGEQEEVLAARHDDHAVVDQADPPARTWWQRLLWGS